MFNKILEDALSSISGARAIIFLDGDGETIALAGDHDMDMKFRGAWKEIHLDHIREIAKRLNLGNVHAVLFSLNEGNELMVEVSGEYCLLLFLSSYAHIREAMQGIRPAVDRLKKEIE
jgi:predicted regulator of Ras-like GTPase activity (Roadblock/LC7/MglB family)